MQCQIGLRLQVCLPAPLPLRLQLHFHLHFRLCLRSSNYVVICAIFGNACNDDNDEANDKFAALSSRLHVARCTLPGWQFLSVELSVRSMSIGLLMAANAST